MTNSTKMPVRLADQLLEIVGLVIVLGSFFDLYVRIDTLPKIIPTHFDGAGTADGWSEKTDLFMMPAISAALWLLMVFLSRRPQMFNYPTTITDENRAVQYRNGALMMRLFAVSLPLVFAILTHSTIQIAPNANPHLDTYWIFIVLALVFAPILFFFIQSSRSNS
jgi:uncharacterized membrane protein